MYMWLYKEDLASGVKVRLDEVDEYIKDGWLDTPDKWGKKDVQPVDGWEVEKVSVKVEKVPVKVEEVEEEECSLEDMDKSELLQYAKALFEVDLDKRKSKPNLIKEIEALENG